MTLTESWNDYMGLLAERAPATAQSVQKARPLADRQSAEQNTTPWTAEMREFYSLHDGQHPPTADGPLIGTLLPQLGLFSLDELVSKHRYCLEPETLHDVDDLGPDWADTASQFDAGEVANMFLEAYVPFAEDGSGGFQYIDTRPGELRGCIRGFSWETADEGGMEYPSLAAYVDSARLAVEAGTELDGLTPTVEDGALIWTVDYPDTVQVGNAPDPRPLQLPFPLTHFLPSQVGPDADQLDLGVLRRRVLEFAKERHSGALVGGGDFAFPRLPRQQGINANSFVSIDGELRVFLVVATGVDNDVLVYEYPPEGFTFGTDESATET